jgi:hypothetical protein
MPVEQESMTAHFIRDARHDAARRTIVRAVLFLVCVSHIQHDCSGLRGAM